MPRLRTAAGVLALAATASLLVAPSAGAADSAHFLDCSATSSGDGSAASPWNALSDANAHVFEPGDTLSLRSGTTCVGTLEPKGQGAEDAPVTVTRYGDGARPVVAGEGAKQWTVRLVDQSWWTISDLHVTNASDTRDLRNGIRVESTTAAHKAGIVIRDNEVSDVAGWGDKTGARAGDFSNSAGIAVRSMGSTVGHVDGITITGNHVHDTGGGGIKIAGETNTYNEDVYIARNTITEVGGDPIVVHNSYAPLVEHNTALDAGYGRYPFIKGNFAGMWPYHSHDPVFQYNVVGRSRASTFDSTAWDCDIDVTGTCLFQYNYSFGNSGGFYLNCISGCANNPTTADVVLRYNVSQDDCRLVLTSAPPGRHYIHNNTFYCPSRPLLDTVGNSEWVNNVFVAPGGTFPGGSLVRYDSNAYLGGIQPPSGDAHAIVGAASDAGFAAPGSGQDTRALPGYRLTVGSPLVGSGAVLPDNGGSDFYGNPVSATEPPHRGAFNGEPVRADKPEPLTHLFNQVAVTADDNPSTGGVDAAGQSFAANALARVGLTPGARVTVGGLAFTWHPTPTGNPDNVKADGQRVALTGTASRIGFLGFASGNPAGPEVPTSGTGTVHYTDGTAEPFTLAFSDWGAAAPTAGDRLVARTAYRNDYDNPYIDPLTAPAARTASFYYTSVPLAAGKRVASVTLPDGDLMANAGLHVLAMSAQQGAPRGESVTVVDPGPQTATTGARITPTTVTAWSSATDATLSWTATGLPEGLALDATTGSVTGTPTVAGPAEVTVTVTDSRGTTGTADFTWDVKAPTPVVNGDFETGTKAPWTGTGSTVQTQDVVRGSYALVLPGSGSAAEQVVSGLEPDTAYVVTGTGRVDVKGELLRLGVKRHGGAEVQATYDELGWAERSATFVTGPTSTTATVYCYKATGTGPGWCDEISVAKAPVAVHSPGAQRSLVGATVDLQLAGVTSEPGHPLTWSATGLPSGLHIDASTGRITGAGVAAGTSQTTVTATDELGRSGSASFEWTVIDPSVDLVRNGGFEAGALAPWSGGGSSVVSDPVHGGAHALRVAGLGSTAEQGITGLAPNTTYRLSGWGRVDTDGAYLRLGAKNYGGVQVSATFTTPTWTDGSVEFRTGDTATSVTVFCFRSSASSVGGAGHCDDVTLHAVG